MLPPARGKSGTASGRIMAGVWLAPGQGLDPSGNMEIQLLDRDGGRAAILIGLAAVGFLPCDEMKPARTQGIEGVLSLYKWRRVVR